MHKEFEILTLHSIFFLSFSVLHYVINITLHYLMLHRLEIHSALELLHMALLCCRLAALRLRKAARWQ